jgi:type II secretory ATPase GspE/PulE/Tfp pilus assembly ATPase PilB-like protein
MGEKVVKSAESTEQFFTNLFEDAISKGASDIHIEPLHDRVRIRFRIDGKLQTEGERQMKELDPIINKIKVLSDLELTSKPVPQDGHFELVQTQAKISEDDDKSKTSAEQHSGLTEKLSSLFGKGPDYSENLKAQAKKSKDNQGVEQVKNNVVDVRVSMFPTTHGEAAVLRLLNRANLIMSLDKFEMNDETKARLKKLIYKNYGMTLVTGPAGSGKTSLLYSILAEVQNMEKNIITLEDPVEYDFEDIRQSSIRPEQGLTFALGMKSILRQDPDIIMIGEIRDPETAEHSIRASLMGRVVFSTVHSNSSVGIIARLIDMGVDRSLVAYALNGAVSKRLIRKVCSACKENYTPDASNLEYFGLESSAGYRFMRGKGCKECNNTGYKGRIGVFEVMTIDDDMRSLIMEKAPMSSLQQYLDKTDMQTLKEDALEKVIAGETTLEEAMTAV